MFDPRATNIEKWRGTFQLQYIAPYLWYVPEVVTILLVSIAIIAAVKIIITIVVSVLILITILELVIIIIAVL